MIKIASQYHDRTSYERNRLSGHHLDWRNQPGLIKEYKNLKNITLPDYKSFQNIPLKAVLNMDAEKTYAEGIDIDTLSAILRLTYCITAKAGYSRGEYYYRNAASAGALYPTEIYTMIMGIDGIEEGIYHFNPVRHSLSLLREGDFSSLMGTIVVPSLKYNPLISFIFSAIFFRSSWKYRDRAYRYHLLDTGHVLENLFLALKALEIPFEIGYDFEDNRLNQLIGIDEFREAGLATVNITGSNIATEKTDLSIETVPAEITDSSMVSKNDIDYARVREIHEAGKNVKREETENNIDIVTLKADSWEKIESTYESQKGIPYPECLFKRRSKRNFIDKAISKQDFTSILDIICLENSFKSLKTALFAEKVEGVEPGLYCLNRTDREFGNIRQGIFGERIAHICLDQEWLKNAGLHFLMISDLGLLDRTYGPRGYRYTMMNAGRIGQRLYITATSLGLGCCGIGAFYDNEAIELLDLDGNTRLLYLLAIGKIKSKFLIVDNNT